MGKRKLFYKREVKFNLALIYKKGKRTAGSGLFSSLTVLMLTQNDNNLAHCLVFGFADVHQTGHQGWKGYFEDVIGYRLPYLKCNK